MVNFKIKRSNGEYFFQNQAFYEKLGIGKKKNEAVEEILTTVAFILTILIMTLLWIIAE
jgi:uncharacterized membrane protein